MVNSESETLKINTSLTDRLKAALACDTEQDDYKLVRDKWPGAPGSSADYYTRGRVAERARTSAIEAALIELVGAIDKCCSEQDRFFTNWAEVESARANLEREIVGMG